MHSRAVRSAVVALLLVAAAGAAFQVWRHDSQTRSLDARALALDAVPDRMLPAAAELTAAQRAYADSGLREPETFERFDAILQQLTTDAARFRVSTESAESARHLDSALGTLADLTTAAARARERLNAQEPLAAADLLLGSQAQEQVAAMAASLGGFRAAELQWVRERRATLAASTYATLGAVALLWVGALVLLVRAAGAKPRARENTADAASAAAPEATGHAQRTHLDLQAIADVCTGIARLTDATALPPLLERAATVLDARGIMLWMGGGNELFPAGGFGYDAAVLQRLRPIPRSADNATASAWRTSEMRTVSGDASGPGAIVAPMCAPDGCIGVLAAEVRNGRETDADVRALAAILAAQLAGVLTAWPAASTAASGTAAGGSAPRRSQGNAAAS